MLNADEGAVPLIVTVAPLVVLVGVVTANAAV
jgi:hypothetical protein